MDSLDIKSYLPLFIEETKENIQQMSQDLLQLEQDYEDTEAIDNIFRYIHTIKGMSATMGYADISNLTHQAENLLDEVRHHQAKITPGMIDGFFEVVDEIERQLAVLESSGEPGTIGEERVRQILASFSEEEEETLQDQQETSLEEHYRLEIEFSNDCLLKPARAMIVCNQLAGVCSKLETQPPQDSLPTLDSLDKFLCIICTDNPQQVQDILAGGVEIQGFTMDKIQDDPSPAKEEPATSPPPSQTDVVTATGSEEDHGHETDNKPEVSKRVEPHLKNLATIRVDTEKLDQLLNLVSELVINKTSIQQAAAGVPDMADGVEHLHRLTGDLQNIVMNMRMIPLETVFQRFPRMVRDTAHALHKKVQLEIQGAETELDRTIIDDIADPLVHLMRNAVDHGIESGPERLSRGKPEAGKIVLRAYQTGNQVVIEVSDDGYGLDLDRIRAKAHNAGLLNSDESEDSLLTNFIFSPGFTTSENVTDISGRGVGLDVVKNSIESLGGTIEVVSAPNVGTTFRISLPLTLAIIQGLLVACGSETFVIPLSYVQETDIIEPADIQTVGHQQIVMFRGKVLPVVFLAQLMGCAQQTAQEMSLVVVRSGDREVGIISDDLLTQQEIVIKNISWGQRFFKNYLGSTILGDGSVVLILDVNVLLSGVKFREGYDG